MAFACFMFELMWHVHPSLQLLFRDASLAREYGRLLCYDAGLRVGTQLAEAAQVVTNTLGDDKFALPGLAGVSGSLNIVRSPYCVTAPVS